MANQYPYKYRAITARLEHLFSRFSSVVILGARQVGKSTMLEHVFPDVPRVVFDPVEDIHNARKDPDLFLDSHPAPLILDEIQYVPELVPALKRRIDTLKKPGLYLITGSQQWGVIKEIAESLAGRTVLMHLEGFSLAEIAESVNDNSFLHAWLENPEAVIGGLAQRIPSSKTVYEQLWRGFLPETHFLDLDVIPDFHTSYQRTYIERDIRLIAGVSDLQLFSRFVKLLAALTAQEIDYSQVGRDIGISPKTAKKWMNILNQAFEWFEIPPYSNNAIKKISKKPKGYFVDTGQVCYSQMISSPQAMASHPLWGAIFENAVVNELRKQASVISTPPQFYHWRAHSGAECDLILERDGKFFPIEIKAKTKITRNDARGIRSFRKNYPGLNIQKGAVISLTHTIYPVAEDVYAIPWDLQ